MVAVAALWENNMWLAGLLWVRDSQGKEWENLRSLELDTMGPPLVVHYLWFGDVNPHMFSAPKRVPPNREWYISRSFWPTTLNTQTPKTQQPCFEHVCFALSHDNLDICWTNIEPTAIFIYDSSFFFLIGWLSSNGKLVVWLGGLGFFLGAPK